MKRTAWLGCLLIIAPLAVAAQAGTQTGARNFGLVQLENPNGQPPAPATASPNLCPAGMQASHLADGSTVRTGGAHPRGIGQRIHLTLTNSGNRTIASATLEIRGWIPEARMQQAATDKHSAQAVRRLVVRFQRESERTVSADLWVPGLSAVTSIQMAAAQFTDGTTWTLPAGKTCAVVPDLVMLITAAPN
ncbi:MAG: hypothetical protein ACLGPM_04315 [Acidobacteriota bacterium]